MSSGNDARPTLAVIIPALNEQETIADQVAEVLAVAAAPDLPARIARVIVIDNGGGNIFRFIEGPDKDPGLLEWFEAPHTRDIEKLVKSYDLPYFQASDMTTLKAGLDALYAEHDRPAVLHIITDALTSPKVLRDYFDQLRTS